jgi:tetratricopeptide (TPR) repeat protein
MRAEGAGDLAEAEGHYRALVAADPDDASAWFALSRVLTGQRRPEAVNALQRAVALDPVLADSTLFAGDRAWWNGDYADALVRYRDWLALKPGHPFALYASRRIAECLLRLDRPQDARTALEEVLRFAPGHADSLVELGLLFREQGRLQQAIEQLEAARASLPEMAHAAMALGQTYLQAGEVPRAVTELEAAVAQRPCWAIAHGQLAAGLARMGRTEDADFHLGLALSLQPGNPQIRRIAQQLHHTPKRTVAARP